MNHIISTIDPDKSWCERIIEPNEQPFKTLDQAAMNGLFPSKKPVCDYCVNRAVSALLKNLEADNDNPN